MQRQASVAVPWDDRELAVELSTRYITGRFHPDKAIDVMDEAGSRARLKEITLPDGVTRPYAMFLSGFYPRALDGLANDSRRDDHRHGLLHGP